MIKFMYAVYDKQTNHYGQPFPAVNDTLAKRAYDSLKENPQSDLHKYPQDYNLYRLGTFNTETGKFESAVEKLPDTGH